MHAKIQWMFCIFPGIVSKLILLTIMPSDSERFGSLLDPNVSPTKDPSTVQSSRLSVFFETAPVGGLSGEGDEAFDKGSGSQMGIVTDLDAITLFTFALVSV